MLSVSAPNVEILSPHFDDAVYSCWHAIDDTSRIITVFGGYPVSEEPSRWDVSTGFNNSRIATETRALENAEALKSTGAKTLNLPFKDTVYRKLDELNIIDVYNSLSEVLTPDSPVLAPSGFSYGFLHADHVLLREVAKLFLVNGKDVSFYADIPYSLQPDDLKNWPSHLPLDAIRKILEIDIDIEVIELNDDAAKAKEKAVRVYASQFGRNNALAKFVFDNPLAFRWEAIIRPIS